MPVDTYSGLYDSIGKFPENIDFSLALNMEKGALGDKKSASATLEWSCKYYQPLTCLLFQRYHSGGLVSDPDPPELQGHKFKLQTYQASHKHLKFNETDGNAALSAIRVARSQATTERFLTTYLSIARTAEVLPAIRGDVPAEEGRAR